VLTNNLKTKNRRGRKNDGRENLDKLLVVGIGASAGGLEAFTETLKNLPDDTGMSFVLVQHLDPKHESHLTQILSKITTLPVHEIKNNISMEANKIYLIPPDKYLQIKNRKLILSARKKNEGIFMPIDYFFQSLANEEKNRAIGVILSGTGSDGTLGLKAIKAKGGITIAQTQDSAKYSGMPDSAIDSGYVDAILPPNQIAKELIRISKHPYIAFTKPLEKEFPPEKEDDSLLKIFRKLRLVTGVDFTHYKSNTIKRRISRRMVIKKIVNIDHYLKYILENKDEINELYQDLLINVTNFFRDIEVYDSLKEKVFNRISKKISADNPIRIWVPGCSTGEEVYSIAISLLEFLEKKSLIQNIQIFGTDISEPSIEKARSGFYSDESGVKKISKTILKKYFIKTEQGFQINKIIRDKCIFARQDILKDPPFSKIDFISCRNLLIYLSSEIQKKIIPIFHYALKSEGFLLLGSSESIGGFADLFYLIDKKNKLYEKKFSGKLYDYNFDLSNRPPEKISAVKKYKDIIPSNLDIQKEADRIIINKYSPAGILINKNLDIIQFRGKVNQFLEPGSGEASLNLFRMIREGLNIELHTALKKAKITKKPVLLENISIRINGSFKMINLEVIPLKAFDSHDQFFLILFTEKNNIEDVKKGRKVKDEEKLKTGNDKFVQIEKLRKELSITKEHLQSIIEEREAANEELRSALEELQSSNEELQSTNEEMETAREELQSTNEELVTVNDELENRNNELSIINNDLINLISSVHIPIIMLDNNLKIRRYTPKAEKIWNLISTDIGRPISNIKPNFEITDLKENILNVLDNLELKEIEVKDNEGNWYSLKIRPYRTIENKIDGVVISLLDVDFIKKAFDGKSADLSLIRSALDLLEQPVLILDNNLKILEINKPFLRYLNSKKNKLMGESIGILSGELDINPLQNILEKIQTHKTGELINTSVKTLGKKRDVINLTIQKIPILDKVFDFILLVGRR
jgi:two-component system CheB/CheR fusion protein